MGVHWRVTITSTEDTERPLSMREYTRITSVGLGKLQHHLLMLGLEHQLNKPGICEMFRNCAKWLAFSAEFLRFVPMNKEADGEAKQRRLPAQTRSSNS